MKIVTFLQNTGLLIKVVTETVKIEVKEQKGEFLGMLAAMLASNLMVSMLLGKGVI